MILYSLLSGCVHPKGTRSPEVGRVLLDNGYYVYPKDLSEYLEISYLISNIPKVLGIVVSKDRIMSINLTPGRSYSTNGLSDSIRKIIDEYIRSNPEKETVENLGYYRSRFYIDLLSSMVMNPALGKKSLPDLIYETGLPNHLIDCILKGNNSLLSNVKSYAYIPYMYDLENGIDNLILKRETNWYFNLEDYVKKTNPNGLSGTIFDIISNGGSLWELESSIYRRSSSRAASVTIPSLGNTPVVLGCYLDPEAQLNTVLFHKLENE